MSLDFYLVRKGHSPDNPGVGVFIREWGEIREMTRDEWDHRVPGTDPVSMPAPIGVQEPKHTLFERNITHNLREMAIEAGVYTELWHPDQLGVVRAEELIRPLERGLDQLLERPEYFSRFNASNGWGLYEHFVPFVRDCLEACREWPDAQVRTST